MRKTEVDIQLPKEVEGLDPATRIALVGVALLQVRDQLTREFRWAVAYTIWFAVWAAGCAYWSTLEDGGWLYWFVGLAALYAGCTIHYARKWTARREQREALDVKLEELRKEWSALDA